MVINKLLFKVLLVACLFSCSVSDSDKSEAKDQPNIILIFTDDMGYADLGCQGQKQDIRTPNIDALASKGVRMSAGYVTAPQCCPSRAGLITGKYQQRFGFEDNVSGPLPLSEETVADLLLQNDYKTGMVGKWHLTPNFQSKEWIRSNIKKPTFDQAKRTIIPNNLLLPYEPWNRGFKDVMAGNMVNVYSTYDLNGNTVFPGRYIHHKDQYRIDLQSDAAVSFIKKNKKDPFFLYLAYFAPHVPLEAPEKYLSRFPGEMPERRRYALAMISAMDDGVGKIMATLDEHQLTKNTLVFFISDNGAPIKESTMNLPISFKGGAWDGSLNDPWLGEKGTLFEGGIRIPFIASWPGKLPQGMTYDKPVLSLDAIATIATVANANTEGMDGVDLMPYLTKEVEGQPHAYLFWRMWSQEAVRMGEWKLLRLSDGRQFLFNLENDLHEKKDLAKQHPKLVRQLNQALDQWGSGLKQKRKINAPIREEESIYYNKYLSIK